MNEVFWMLYLLILKVPVPIIHPPLSSQYVSDTSITRTTFSRFKNLYALNKQEFDWEIKPQGSLLDLKLKSTWEYRDLLWLLVRRDFVSFYKQTILGPLWFFVQPLFTTIIFTFVFGKLAGISTDGLPQPLFYMAGITSWNYFADCLSKTSTVFKDNAGIFG